MSGESNTVTALRTGGVNCVLVVGVFDLFHVGHVRLLRQARDCGDKLIVAVNADALARDYKREPIIHEESRLEIVRACRYVDEALISHCYDIKPVIVRFGIKTIVHGDEWDRESYLRQIRMDEDYLRHHDINLLFLPYTPSISTSRILAKVTSLQRRLNLSASLQPVLPSSHSTVEEV